MIGVQAKPHQAEAICEFFQLFKTPWEFLVDRKSYDTVISTEPDLRGVRAKLVVIYCPDATSMDRKLGIHITPCKKQDRFLQACDREFPVYGTISTIEGEGKALIRTKDPSQIAALLCEHEGQRIIRVSYDLFEEVSYLVTSGQPPEHASLPVLEMQIALLRSWLLDAGLSFVEIPPSPEGHTFAVCLTHDIDFIRISDHWFDHTMFGFLYRATVETLINVLSGRRHWKTLVRNWSAVLALPLVYLGIKPDFWFQFDRYMEIEQDLKSTFFLVPFKNRPGTNVAGRHVRWRATRYDIQDIHEVVQDLARRGAEIGLHGIDAWHDEGAAREELARISGVTGQSNPGVRIHWLCFDDTTATILEDAGFSYDSTFGYNEAVGFRAGTMQVFKPPAATSLLEVPLVIQDTALFNRNRGDLADDEAWQRCLDIIHTAEKAGGVLTILWHDRSLAPERLYDGFYLRLIEELKTRHAWFATAGEAVCWFRHRRSISFEEDDHEEGKIHLRMNHEGDRSSPPPVLRMYSPQNEGVRSQDIPLVDDITVTLSQQKIRFHNVHGATFQ